MLRIIPKLLLPLSLILLSGCVDRMIDTVEKQKIRGDKFTAALKDEYIMLAQKESRFYNDSIDAQHFAVKAAQAGAGEEVVPEFPADWNIPDAKVAEMTPYRDRLFFSIHKGGREVSPRLAAQAQVAFDCWVEEEEEGHKPEIQKCHDLFLDKIQKLEAAVHEMSPIFVIWFNMNSSQLTEKGKIEIDQIVKTAREIPHHKIAIRGFTDGGGGRKHNLLLSHARAEAVKKAITSNGIPANRISTSIGLGEISGSRELDPNNRRVEIQLF